MALSILLPAHMCANPGALQSLVGGCERKRVERRATMSSSTYKKAIQGRTHKERSQP